MCGSDCVLTWARVALLQCCQVVQLLSTLLLAALFPSSPCRSAGVSLSHYMGRVAVPRKIGGGHVGDGPILRLFYSSSEQFTDESRMGSGQVPY